MNTFFIPSLAGQVYSMVGMETKLHFIADQPGEFTGRNMQFSGQYFPEQYFSVRVVSEEDYQQWLQTISTEAQRLSKERYQVILSV